MTRYLADKNYILRNVAGSHVLISIGDNIANFNGYIQLTETAAVLWKELGEPRTVDELTESLQKEYDVDPAQAESDVKEFIDHLVQEGMVQTL